MQTIDKLKVPIKKIGTHPIFFIGNKKIYIYIYNRITKQKGACIKAVTSTHKVYN